MSGKPARCGYTLIEIMFALAIAIVILTMCFGMLLHVYRVSRMEESLLRLDLNADRADTRLTSALLPAILPIEIEGGKVFAELFNNNVTGFSAFSSDWLSILRAGTDCLAFAEAVDFGDDEDALDSDIYPELGYYLPGGRAAAAAAYDPVGSGNKLRGNVHPYLAALDPRGGELGLGDAGNSSLNTGAGRFQEVFPFPAAADRAFAVIRFVPAHRNHAAVVIGEDAVEGTGGMDLNGDGDRDDRFWLGRLELLYPPWVGGNGFDAAGLQTPWRQVPGSSAELLDANGVLAETIDLPYLRESLTEDVVLLQMNNRSEDACQPIFRLEEFEGGGGAGNYAIRVNLLLYDRGSRILGIAPAVRKYGSLVRLRGM
ncbi:MAG: hypothetical protein LBU23_12750 [Planctomycetota bacterium]|nr:hypothetical protein [Planctomycetota bacterium]